MVNVTNLYVPGTFDLFHVGHIRMFKYASKFGNVIAGVSTDELVLSYKNLAPIYPFKERWETVDACRYVNRVIPQRKFFSIPQLKKLNICYVILGSDWEGKDFPELDQAQKALGFEIIYKPYTEETSSSKIKERIIRNSFDIIKAQLERDL